MQIGSANIWVHDQDKALRFYTEKLGFVKKDDMQDGAWRLVSIVHKDDPHGNALQLLQASFPSARALQKEMFDAEFAIMGLFTKDVRADYERLMKAGVKFIDAPEDGGLVTYAKFDDTCGNLINLMQRKA